MAKHKKTREQYILLERLYKAGKSYILLAAKMRCGNEKVKAMLKELGLEK